MALISISMELNIGNDEISYGGHIDQGRKEGREEGERGRGKEEKKEEEKKRRMDRTEL